MLTFNQLLRVRGLDPADVRLVRHRDPDREKHVRVFKAAFNGDQCFQSYQELQGTEQVIEAFRAAKHLAAFVVEPGTKQTLFVGIWDRLGERIPPATDPFGSPQRPTTIAFETRRRSEFDDYCCRLVVDWGDGTRAWVQRADNRDKPITELRRVREEPQFPGFTMFRHPLDEIGGVPVSWAEVLRNARGVYLLVHRGSGEQYVGSACGEGGFLARWLNYADGHGGNIAMKELGAPASEYDATILEIVGTDASTEHVISRETLWKNKLGSRAKGLNRN